MAVLVRLTGINGNMEQDALPPKQLRMHAPASSVWNIRPRRLPEGYELRSYAPGDEDSWVELLQHGDFANWTMKRLVEYLSDDERREGSCVVSHQRNIVAATFASRQDIPRTGVIDYVVSHPDHRGVGLGRAVTSGVMRFFADQGYENITLTTDDWRLTAIALYLSLSFVPELTREDMPGRWEAVMKNLEILKSE